LFIGKTDLTQEMGGVFMREESKILLVVDFQTDFIDGSLGTPEAQAITENVRRKIIERKEQGYIVVFLMDTHDADYLQTQEGRKLPVIHCVKDTEGWELHSSIRNLANPDDKFIKDTFGGAILNLFFDHRKYPYPAKIELIGVCTDICVVSNALILKAQYPEVEIVVDASCCAGTTPEAHQAALLVMRSCQVEVVND